MKQAFLWRLSGPLPKGLSRDAVESTLRMAMAEWERVCGVKFIKDYGIIEKVDVTFAFGRPTRAYYTAERTTHDNQHFIIFNDTEKWCVIEKGLWGWFKRITQNGKDLFTFTLHELGHCLQLGHVNPRDDKDSVMHPSPESLGLVSKVSTMDGINARKYYPLT
jgi:hypothetical protein